MKFITFTGGKGGVGKSVIAANTAIAITQFNQRAILFDADLQLANLDVLLGIKSTYNLQHVVAEERNLIEIITPGPSGIQVITGGSAVSSLMNAGPKRMGTFLQQLDSLESCADFVIFDTGAGLDNRVMTFLKLASETIIVATPDPTSITDAYATIKMLFKRKPDAVAKVIVNQVINEQEAKQVYNSLLTISRKFLGQGLEYAGSVRHDINVVESIRKRQPFMALTPNCSASMDVKKIAEGLIDKTVYKIA